jgi:hypothetical protein
MFVKWLGLPVGMVRGKPKLKKEPEKPVFNRYRALIDK